MIQALLVVLLAPAPPGPREAVEAYRENPAEAALLLFAAAEASPEIADALKLLEAEARLAAGNKLHAAKVAAGVALRNPLWASRAAWVAARSEPDCGTAKGWLDKVSPDPPWTTATGILTERAALARRCGDAIAAAEHARKLAMTAPGSAEPVALTPAERLKQADAYQRSRQYGKADQVLLALADDPKLGIEARFARGQLHLDRIRRDFRLAERAFAAVAQTDHKLAEEAQYLVGRARGRAGDDAGAQAAYAEYRKRYPKGRHRADAEFFAAFAAYERGQFDQAATAFAEIRRGKWAGAARWYHAWTRYLLGDVEAGPLLSALAGRERPNSRAYRRARYWAARATQAQDPAAAKQAYVELAQQQPHDWYGIWSRRRHGGLPPVPAFPVAVAEPDPSVPGELVQPVAHIRALAAAGLDDFARRALDRVRPRLDPVLLVRLAAEIGDAERQLRSVMRIHGAKFVTQPMVSDVRLWRAAYPRGALSAVVPWAHRRGVPPWLVYSFIRKESAFDVDAVSHAHAIGLMQMMTRTANPALESDGGKGPANLFDPAMNVRLGTWYIAALSRRYHGQLPLLAGAYNAGPAPMNDWLRSIKTEQTDEFVERIPFKEAREYIKLMARTGVVYRLLYDGVDLDTAAQIVPDTLRRDVAPGVEF